MPFLLLMIFACSNDDGNCDNCNQTSNNCDQTVIVNSELYEDAPADMLTIESLAINGDCLKINFGASGCSGDSWELKLIDSEAILESFPPQRNVRLSLKNEELCAAYITRELTFDITDLQTDGDEVMLNIINSDSGILYKY